MSMKMDMNVIIEQMETGEQDAALKALQTYNNEVISPICRCNPLLYVLL